MNRFRTKKKGRDDADGPRPSIESESSGPFRMFGKKRGQNEDSKPNVDLSTALPPSDDFRTSLLMTGLSARFSMLREQDDPTTKVGKASDDSVLYPKRQSRMADFGLASGLQDISEVESIKTPSRLGSFQSDGDGSVLNRGKPVEGNVLFGGRQKIYRIPVNNTGTSKDGGMPGRALYDDDVAMSAFQKWRLAEKEKQTSGDGGDAGRDAELPLEMNPNQRRMTSSTTSSVPSIAARYSTAATSVTSQGGPYVKDSQSAYSVASSTGSGPTVERSVTRTRRLYEQGLNQDLHDQQSSALSRMDTLSKGRAFGSLTPDLTSSSGTFGDRITERRPILAKASAPNLRSFSPPVSSTSSIFPTDASTKPSQNLEPKISFGANPPLSPPISETEEHPILPIQPNDRGKATAMGVFDRPLQKYDDSKYTQRQRQLQQGRDSPTGNSPVESPAVGLESNSRSGSSIPRKLLAKTEPLAVKKELAIPEDPPSFFDDSDDSSILNPVVSISQPPKVSLERPADNDHPAFRKSALPTPLSLGSRSPASFSPSKPTLEEPEDSPTLGPNTGLSGMVRAHLRSDSNASSIYGLPSQEIEATNSHNSWKLSLDSDVSRVSSVPAPVTAPPPPPTDSRSPSRHTVSSEETDKEEDEFARHLADGARRVREKLTSIADAESDKSAPPTPLAPQSGKDLNPHRTNPLGILRSQSSRGSLLEGDGRDTSQSRSMRTAISSTSASASSPSHKTPADGADELNRGRSPQVREKREDEVTSNEKEENIHVGLKAFRQARRELQKMKELETKQRHQAATVPERSPMNSRAMSHDTGGPPPAMFNRMPRDESRNGSGSRAGSRTGSRAPSERDRSGSETSNNGQPQMRSMRLRNGSVTYEEQHMPSSPSTGGWNSAGLRQGGPPGVRQRSYEMGLPSPMSPPNGFETRPRNGSMLGATASTPNLHAGPPAPPLPPINPRRKNGFLRSSEDDLHAIAHQLPGGFPSADDSEDDMNMEQRRQQLRRATSEGNSLRTRNSPPRTNVRPPLPSGTMSSRMVPGGMI